MSKDNLLTAAARLWSDIKAELEPATGDSTSAASSSGSLADQDQVAKEEVKKVAKWLQHSVTKFAASAAVAEGPNDPALKPMAAELVKAFTAAAGTLLSIKKGAGPTLMKELWEVGSSLAKSLETLGGAVGSKSMAVQAGQVLDRVKHFDRVSCGNRSAARRRLLTSLTQVRDAAKELEKVIASSKEKEGGKDDADADGDSADDFDDFDGEELEPEELVVMEGVARAVAALEEIFKEGSSACAASAASSSSAVPGVAELEGIVASASAAQKAIDGIVAHGLGGMDVKACTESLEELRAASKDFGCCAGFAVEASLGDWSVRSALCKVRPSKSLRLQETPSEAEVPRSRTAYLNLFAEEQHPLARCLDGSMAGYYLRRGSETKRFLIFLEGGGWCYDQSCSPTEAGTMADCKSRSATDLGSSSKWGRTQDDWWLTGIMSSDYTSNPVFYNWTTILVPYCDGASFTGNATKDGLQFRGSMILEALMVELKKKTDISEAAQVVIAGRSAGASAVYYHIDKLSHMLSLPSGTVKGIADAGFFLDARNKDGVDCWPDQMMSLWGSVGLYEDLHRPCLDHLDADDKWKCLFPEFFAHTIETPIFIVNSLYDTSELTYTLGLACCPGECHLHQRHCDESDEALFDHMRGGHEKAWSPLAHKPGNGVWAISCLDHTLTWEHWTSPQWEVPSGSRTTASVAVAKWLAGEDVHIEDQVPFPQNKGCSDHNLVS